MDGFVCFVSGVTQIDRKKKLKRVEPNPSWLTSNQPPTWAPPLLQNDNGDVNPSRFVPVVGCVFTKLTLSHHGQVQQYLWEESDMELTTRIVSVCDLAFDFLTRSGTHPERISRNMLFPGNLPL